MATSGSTSVAVTNHDTLKFSWYILSQSTENNTSTVGWSLQLITDEIGRISSKYWKDYTIVVNGVTYSGQNKIGISNNSTKVLVSGSTVIEHGNDGRKTFEYSFYQVIEITFAGTFIRSSSGEGIGELKTIVKPSTIQANNGTLGTEHVLTVSRNSSEWTHTITYECGTMAGTICENSQSESIVFTLPVALASQNTTGSSVSVALIIETFGEGQSAGTTTTTITCIIPDSVVPTLTLNVTDAEGYSRVYGGFVQNESKYQIDAIAAGAYGSEISAYKITANGKTYTEASITTDVIAASGEAEIFATVTDSRGRTGTASVTVNVLEYVPPRILSLNAKRCNESGASSSNGAYLAVSFDSEITSLDSRNAAEYVIQFKKTTETSYVFATLQSYAGQHSIKGGTYIFPAAMDATYDIILTVSDAFNDIPRGVTGASCSKLFSILKRGLGFAFGKVAELENVFDVAFKSRFLGGFLYPELSNGVDLDTQTTPNRYMLKSGSAYVNAPAAEVDAIFDIIGRADETLLQRFTVISKAAPIVYERVYDTDGWNTWADVNTQIWNNFSAVYERIDTEKENSQTEFANVRKEMQQLQPEILLAVYPVGSIYMSMNPTSPEKLFGGKWQAMWDTFLYGSNFNNSAGDTGGAASYELNLTHKHIAPIGYNSDAMGGININGTESTGKGDDYATAAIAHSGTLPTDVNAYYTSDATMSETIPTMPPYTVVHMWQRIE